MGCHESTTSVFTNCSLEERRENQPGANAGKAACSGVKQGHSLLRVSAIYLLGSVERDTRKRPDGTNCFLSYYARAKDRVDPNVESRPISSIELSSRTNGDGNRDCWFTSASSTFPNIHAFSAPLSLCLLRCLLVLVLLRDCDLRKKRQRVRILCNSTVIFLLPLVAAAVVASTTIPAGPSSSRPGHFQPERALGPDLISGLQHYRWPPERVLPLSCCRLLCPSPISGSLRTWDPAKAPRH